MPDGEVTAEMLIVNVPISEIGRVLDLLRELYTLDITLEIHVGSTK